MEHRWCERQPVNIAAVIYHQGYGGVAGTIRNVSTDGLFVSSSTMDITTGAVLEVTFPLTIGGMKQRIFLPAMVVHRYNQGAGLMLLRPLSEELYQLMLAPAQQHGALAA